MEDEGDKVGLAVIITNDYEETPQYDTLNGTRMDGERLEEAFRSLRFEVQWKRNICKAELEQVIRQVQSKPLPIVRRYRCILFVFSGHGEMGGKLIMQDGREVDTWNELISPLLPGQARDLGEIPKVFIIDACRGKNETETTKVPQLVTDKGNGSSVDPTPQEKGGYENDVKVPARSNYLIAHSTLPGCISNDYRGNGSLWLEILAKRIPLSDVSIDDLLTEVNEELHERFQPKDSIYRVQQPERTGVLNKKLFLLRDPGQASSAKSQEVPMDYTTPEQHQPLMQSQQLASQKAVEGAHSIDGITSSPNQAAAARVTSPSAPIASGTSVKQETQTPAPLPITREQGSRKFRDRLKQHTNPKYDYISEQLPSGAKRHRCNISFRRDGKVKYADSGGYLTTKQGAAENAAKRALKQENWLSDSENN